MPSKMKQMSEFEQENVRLKKVAADLLIDKEISRTSLNERSAVCSEEGAGRQDAGDVRAQRKKLRRSLR